MGAATQRETSLGVLPSEHPRERYFKSSVKALGDGRDGPQTICFLALGYCFILGTCLHFWLSPSVLWKHNCTLISEHKPVCTKMEFVYVHVCCFNLKKEKQPRVTEVSFIECVWNSMCMTEGNHRYESSMLHTEFQLIIISWKSKWKYLFHLKMS